MKSLRSAERAGEIATKMGVLRDVPSLVPRHTQIASLPSPHESANHVGASVLIVDDNSAKRLAIRSIIESLDLTIVEADSGEGALREVMRRAFSVILLDVRMPIMDGYETAQLIRMRAESERTPIIFITANAPGETFLPLGYANGAVDFIFAPVIPDILRAKVSVFVELFLKSSGLERSLVEATELGEAFRDSEARTRAVLENVADGIVTVSASGMIESFNRSASELFGYEEHEVLGHPFSMIIENGLPEVFSLLECSPEKVAGVSALDERPAEALGRRRDRSVFPIEIDVTDVQLGKRRIFIACLRDVSERRKHTEALQFEAVHDHLTGLPNRVLFADRVDLAIRSAARSGAQLVVLLIDLDEFKQVNDTLGHEGGDDLLKLVTERLAACLRDSDTVARLGGDEFGILLPAGTDLAGAASVSWKIRRALESSFYVGGQAIAISLSIGAALYPDHGDNIDDLLRRADLAMYHAKSRGSGYAVFATDQEEGPARRVTLLGELRRCVQDDELVLHYQPIVSLATRETIGLEALLRWNHPSGELMMPGDFIPVVERNELIVPLTGWVIREAIAALGSCRDAGYDLTMSVNLGARCLVDDNNLFEDSQRLMSQADIPSDKLIFELTETALIDTTVPGLTTRLENMDARLSIDDFGTGYSSLVYLQRLPVVEVKADRSFVAPLATVDDAAVIVKSIIDLGHNLNLNVVAEGVEDEFTLDRLIELRCDAAQGYYFSRAIPLDALQEWLETSPFGARSTVKAGLK